MIYQRVGDYKDWYITKYSIASAIERTPTLPRWYADMFWAGKMNAQVSHLRCPFYVLNPNQIAGYAQRVVLTSRVTVEMKHPQLHEDGWKRITLPTSGAASESMSSTLSGRTLGLTLNGVLVCSATFTSSTQEVTTASFSAFSVDHVQYTTPCSRGTKRKGI